MQGRPSNRRSASAVGYLLILLASSPPAAAQQASDDGSHACAATATPIALDIARHASSSNWRVVADGSDDIAGLRASAQAAGLADDGRHVLNLASDWDRSAIFDSIALAAGETVIDLTGIEGRIIAFVTHPEGSTALSVSLSACSEIETPDDGGETSGTDADDTDTPSGSGGGTTAGTSGGTTSGTTGGTAGGTAGGATNGTTGGTTGDGDSGGTSGGGLATGLPKRDARGQLVRAQVSGLPIAATFDYRRDDYWATHPGVAGTLSPACIALHDSYWTRGPDGLAYATWHPSVASLPDGQTCRFGHEHGDDPSTSPFYTDAEFAGLAREGFIPVPFGYANEVLASNGGMRHEDHFGHKLYRERFRQGYGNSVGIEANIQPTEGVCDALLKLHQGTHSADGLSNHLHEAIAHLSCTPITSGWQASRVHVTTLVPLGRPGWFSNNCIEAYRVPGQTSGTAGNGENNARYSGTTGMDMGMGNPPIALGGPSRIRPLDSVSPDEIAQLIDGERIIPGAACVNTYKSASAPQVNNRRYGHAANDTWVRPLMITGADGNSPRMVLKSYYSVHNPSRVFFIENLDLPESERRVTTRATVEACRNPPAVAPSNPSDLCRQVLADPSIGVFDVASPYNGTVRNVNFKSLQITNDTGAERLWTDAFGRQVDERDPRRAIRQYVSTGNNGVLSSNVAASLATTGSNKVCRPETGGRYPDLPVTDACHWAGNDDLLFAKEWWRDYSNRGDGVHSPN